MYPDRKTGLCPLKSAEKPVAFYFRLEYFFRMGIFSEEKIKPFREEFERRCREEDGFQNLVDQFKERQAKRKGGGRGGAKGGRTVTLPAAGQREDPDGRGQEYGLATGRNASSRQGISVLIIGGRSQNQKVTAVVNEQGVGKKEDKPEKTI